MKWRQIMKSINLFLLLLVCIPIFASKVDPLTALRGDIRAALANGCPKRYCEHRRLVNKFANSSISKQEMSPALSIYKGLIMDCAGTSALLRIQSRYRASIHLFALNIAGETGGSNGGLLYQILHRPALDTHEKITLTWSSVLKAVTFVSKLAKMAQQERYREVDDALFVDSYGTSLPSVLCEIIRSFERNLLPIEQMQEKRQAELDLLKNKKVNTLYGARRSIRSRSKYINVVKN